MLLGVHSLLQSSVTCCLADEVATTEMPLTGVCLLSHEPTTYVALKGRSVVMTTVPSKFRLVRPGLTKAPKTVSIMSVEKPGWYLRHYSYRLYLEPIANPRNKHIFDKDATFIEHVDFFKKGTTTFRSVNYPAFFISRVGNKGLYIRRFQNTNYFKESASFAIMPTGNRYSSYTFVFGSMIGTTKIKVLCLPCNHIFRCNLLSSTIFMPVFAETIACVYIIMYSSPSH